MKKVAILTNGGDAPGLNAVIRAIVKTAEYTGQTANMEISIPDALVTIINE